jgi:hypothetical protein
MSKMQKHPLIIVCPPAFRRECERYALFKRANGINCQVVAFDHAEARQKELASSFISTVGIDKRHLDDPASCLKVVLTKYFVLHHARYVLLAGDTDVLPMAWFEFQQGGNRYFYPSDLYFADLFNHRPAHPGLRKWQCWDPDADGVKGEFRASELSGIDFVPDLAVGRIPASTEGELQTAFARLTGRHVRPPRIILIRGNEEKGRLTEWLDGVMREAAQLLDRFGYPTARFAIPDRAPKSEADAVLSALRQELRGGAEYIFWFGHGAANGWAAFGPHFFSFPTEVPNVVGSPVVFSMSCEVGTYSAGVYGGGSYFSGGRLVPAPQWGTPAPTPDSLQPVPSSLNQDYAAEEWLVRHGAGASALIAGHSWLSLGSPEGRRQPLDFIQHLFGPQDRLVRTVGECFQNTLVTYIQHYRDTLKRADDGRALNHLLRLHLFGDPTTPMAY